MNSISQLKRTCRCGCGDPPSGRSVFRVGHFKILQRFRARLSGLKEYARKKKISFSLTLSDVRGLLGRLPDLGESKAIERLDMDKGFTPGNIILRPKKTRSRSFDPAALTQAVEPMLVRSIERQLKYVFRDGERGLTVENVCEVFIKQSGKCAVSGMDLLLDKAFHAQSLGLTRRDPEVGWTPDNTMLTTLAYKVMTDKWGLDYVTKIVGLASKRLKKKERKNP